MRISARARYAARILLDLALHHDGSPIRAGEVAKRTGISGAYIEQILQPLKRAGFVRSVRGVNGGYILERQPEDLNLADIIGLMEGDLMLTNCCEEDDTCGRTDFCLTRKVWRNASKAMAREMEKVSLKDLMDGEVPACPVDGTPASLEGEPVPAS